jgi:hypothetical protein
MSVPSWLLAQITSKADSFLTDSTTQQRLTETIDDNGAVVRSPSTVATLDCRLMPFTARSDLEGELAMAESVRNYYILAVPSTADIRDGDLFVIASTTYQMRQFYTDHTDAVHIRLIVAEVPDG